MRGWSGWTGFAALLLLIVGAIDFFDGLIAAIRKQYYVLTPNQVIVFDVKTWGWITMILGVIIILVALGVASGAGWARWTAIVVLVVNLFALYGLTVRWRDNETLAAS